MTRSLHIAKGLSLPTDLVTETFAIVAKRRVGKSYTARRIVEQLFRSDLQIVVVDPKGDWWGMRSAADGKGPGLPILILGGEHGDVPLEPGSGELVAKLVVEERVSLLLDISHFRKSEVARFVTDFAETLYRLKAREEFRSPMMLILDEADAVAPQKPQHGEERMLGAVEDIVRRGGQRGIGCGLITQRSAVLNKNVLTQSQLLIALRTIAPQDLKAMDAWIDVHGTLEQRKELMASLPSLPRGDAWFWSPGWPTDEGIFKRVHVLPIETFDSGATPKAGEKRIEPRKRADVDVEILRKQMAATVERAKAQDPRELQKRIKELEAELVKARKAKEPKAKVEIREVYVLKEGQLKRIEALFERGQKIGTDIAAGCAELAKVVAPAVQTQVAPPPRASMPAPRPPPVPHPRPFPRAAPATAPKETGELSGYAMHLVQTIARRHPMALSRSQISTLSGRSPRSSSFDGAMGDLLKAGILVKDRDLYMLTDEGLKIGGATVGQPQSPEEVRATWLRALPAYESTMLQALMQRYPHAVTRELLAQDIGKSITSSSFDGAISALRKNGLATVEQGQVRASDTLFMEASA